MSTVFDQERHARVWDGLSRRIERRKRLHAGARWLIVGIGSVAVSALLLHTVTAKADHGQAAQSVQTEPSENAQISALSGGDGGLRAD